MKYPYIIIDTDKETANTIQIALEDKANYICVGIAHNEQMALDLILDKRPSLVFLNPETPGVDDRKTRYALLTELSKYITKLPEFIVMSSTTKFAVEGIRNKILDYIVKPAGRSSIIKALLRFEKSFEEVSETTLCFKSYGG